MSSTERDTHFAGFAKALYDEIAAITDEWVDPASVACRHEREQVIARRAYDLVQHVLSYVNIEHIENMRIDGDSTLSMASIPDMSALPEVQECE